MKKKILAMLLLSSMLISTFASCSESGTNTEETTAADANAPAAEEVVEEVEEEITLESAAAQYADRDYGGYEYRVADREAMASYDLLAIIIRETDASTDVSFLDFSYFSADLPADGGNDEGGTDDTVGGEDAGNATTDNQYIGF